MFRNTLTIISFTICLISTGFSAEKDTLLLRISKISNTKTQAKELNKGAENCWKTGQYSKGLLYANKGLAIARKYHYQKEEASFLNNMGIIYDYEGNYPLALKNYFEALKIQEKIKDKNGVAYTLSNIGLIYSNQNSNEAALKYHYRSLQLRKELKFKGGISASYNNIGICHLNTKDYKKALFFFGKSKEIDVELKDSMGLMDDLNNMGICYMKTNQIEKALETFNECLALRIHFDDQFGTSKVYSNIGTCYSIDHKLDEAEKYFLKGLEIAKRIKGKENIWYSYENLSEIYEAKKDFRKAFDYMRKAQKEKDELTSESSIREEAETELTYQFEKKSEVARLIQIKKDVQDKEKQKQARIVVWSMVSILVMIGIFAFILFRRWKIASEQRRIIDIQRAIVQEKNTEIVDSINYAQRIQSAILPSVETLNEIFEKHALVYQPKDIVAGDFYWTHTVDDTTYFAVADCTGHGVPGAFMSLLCNNALNRAILEYGAREPGTILNRARGIIVTEFAKSQLNLRDGMDISFCAWNKTTNTCTWAGANNPLWVLYPDNSEMFEIKGDKQPVGNHHHLSDFTTHSVELKPGARLYLFTDGIADQFGEVSGKKFKSKQLKEMLVTSRSNNVKDQAKLVLDTVNGWKGNLEQIDDVCLLIVEIGN